MAASAETADSASALACARVRGGRVREVETRLDLACARVRGGRVREVETRLDLACARVRGGRVREVDTRLDLACARGGGGRQRGPCLTLKSPPTPAATRRRAASHVSAAFIGGLSLQIVVKRKKQVDSLTLRNYAHDGMHALLRDGRKPAGPYLGQLIFCLLLIPQTVYVGRSAPVHA